MTIDDILKLVNAGFTADQIGQMMRAGDGGQPQQAPAAAAAPEPEDPPAQQQAADPEPEDDPYTKIMSAIDDKFKEMAEALKMPANPSMNDIKPLGLEDIVKNFFKEE